MKEYQNSLKLSNTLQVEFGLCIYLFNDEIYEDWTGISFSFFI